jgi:hypothetical protein
MKKFNVYKHPELGYEAIKVGACWPALFNVYWMLYKKLWLIAVIWIFLWMIEGGFESADALFLIWPMFIFMTAYPIYVGNQWLQIRLEKKGYELLGDVLATSATAAVGKIIEPNKQPLAPQEANNESKI